MLIGIMGNTLGEVYANRDRNSLKMTTDLYTDFIGWLNLVGPEVNETFKQSRYMYVAKRIEAEDDQNTVDKEQIEELAKTINLIDIGLVHSLENEAELIAEQ